MADFEFRLSPAVENWTIELSEWYRNHERHVQEDSGLVPPRKRYAILDTAHDLSRLAEWGALREARLVESEQGGASYDPKELLAAFEGGSEITLEHDEGP